jgi:predicted nucleic acid-binding protein
MISALLDTNIVLDVLLDRQPFVTDSKAIWDACDSGRIRGYITATTLTTIYYVIPKTKGRIVARNAVDVCLSAFEIGPVYRETLSAARKLDGPDFEDDVQIATAITSSLDCIVTRNVNDFAASPIKVYSPAEALQAA